MIAPYSGHHLNSNFGTVAKCPFCDATNIPRTSKVQVTCGKLGCREMQNRAAARIRDARAKARRAK